MYSLTKPIKIKKGQKIAKLIIFNKKTEEMNKIDSIKFLICIIIKYNDP